MRMIVYEAIGEQVQTYNRAVDVDRNFFFFGNPKQMHLRIPCPGKGYVGLALFNGLYPLKLQGVSGHWRFESEAGSRTSELLFALPSAMGHAQ